MLYRTTFAVVVAANIALCGAAFAGGSAPFTDQQAEDGHTKFNNHCAQCHGPKLQGALGPNLMDDKFKAVFAGKPLSNLRQFVWENMPQTAPKSLPDDQIDPIIAWILKNNGLQANGKPFSKEAASAEFPK